MEVIAPDIIRELANKHIGRYLRLIENYKNGDTSVRVKECNDYAQLWLSIAKKDYEWKSLTTIERMEVQDALYDEV